MSESLNHRSYDLAYTVFFPLTGNPVGFHHLLLAEVVLRQFPQLKKIVFILSNGKHPDPTKEQQIADPQLRLEILKNALREFSMPPVSFLARVAREERQAFMLDEQNTCICTVEFECNEAVKLADHVIHLKQNAKPDTRNPPLRLVLGDDLVRRMRNPDIFSNSELFSLAENCRFLIASREKTSVAESIQILKKTRNVSLHFHEIEAERLPQALHPWFDLSSTRIRKMAQGGHVLTCFLPDNAARLVEQHVLFQTPTGASQINEWQQACRLQERLVDQSARKLKEVLDHRANMKWPHTLSFVETSTGGLLTAALAVLPGISRHLKEGAILYDQEAKERLLGKSRQLAAVSKECAMQLAKSFQEQSQADFVLAESGMAGPPEGNRRSQKQGQCEMALATSHTLRHVHHQSSLFHTKKEHQLRFAHAALEWLRDTLEKSERRSE